MSKFDPDTTNWSARKQRFDNKKANTVVGSSEVKAFEALYQVRCPQTISQFLVDKLIWNLDELFPKRTSRPYERSQFFRIFQQPTEASVDYANQLRKVKLLWVQLGNIRRDAANGFLKRTLKEMFLCKEADDNELRVDGCAEIWNRTTEQRKSPLTVSKEIGIKGQRPAKDGVADFMWRTAGLRTQSAISAKESDVQREQRSIIEWKKIENLPVTFTKIESQWIQLVLIDRMGKSRSVAYTQHEALTLAQFTCSNCR